MGADSKIEWTHATFNPWLGCTKVSPACKHCYAETFISGRMRLPVWGLDADRKVTSESNWKQPLSWDRKAKATGERHRVFCASLADVFEDRADLAPHRQRLARLIAATPNLDWLLLTKRASAMLRITQDEMGWTGAWPENVWAGCTVESQAMADERIPYLLAVPAKVRFLSMEPLLGPVNLHPYLCEHGSVDRPEQRWSNICDPTPDGIHWVIVGGESGHHARPMHPAWARSLRDQCVAAGVPFLFKQWGEFIPIPSQWASSMGVPSAGRRRVWLTADGRAEEQKVLLTGPTSFAHEEAELCWDVGKKTAGRELDGRTWDEVPK